MQIIAKMTFIPEVAKIAIRLKLKMVHTALAKNCLLTKLITGMNALIVTR